MPAQPGHLPVRGNTWPEHNKNGKQTKSKRKKNICVDYDIHHVLVADYEILSRPRKKIRNCHRPNENGCVSSSSNNNKTHLFCLTNRTSFLVNFGVPNSQFCCGKVLHTQMNATRQNSAYPGDNYNFCCVVCLLLVFELLAVPRVYSSRLFSHL